MVTAFHVRPIAQLPKRCDPQISHRGALKVRDGGAFKVLNFPIRVSAASISAGKRMVPVGEHTVAVLGEAVLSEMKPRESGWRKGSSADGKSTSILPRGACFCLPQRGIRANLRAAIKIRNTGRAPS